MANLENLNFNLAFTADVLAAKTKIKDLLNSLQQLAKTSTSNTNGLGLTKEIHEASVAALDLRDKLAQATSSTGKLDLGQFNLSLIKSGKTLKDYANDLASLGPEGVKAFNQVASAIILAEVPLKKTSALFSKLATTMKNTALWLLSSSVLHGFMGAIQLAYGYAQDLNESLNNIRIVTGYSIDKMAGFADEANKAAKALSTTTTSYTDAALIFYLQGLPENEISERVEATIKMANVTGESAQKISDQMTAVWNNFTDGTHTLEYYGDAMTALGAATASSTDEIANGVSKFAAIADTVGLSFDYAAASLATVTALTRESAETVGTALKTIFSRMEGLSLGKTLEDGTDLNKYSQALLKVGVNIKDVNGDLRDMDSILEDTGAVWLNLADDEQVALAQAVAGVRQYNQFIALMDNWGEVQKNVKIASESEGTLDKLQEIFAEGWEAASKRVKAAMQGIYQDVLDDNVFIGALNAIEKLVSGIDFLIDSMGGLQTIIPLIGTILMKAFGPDISNSINRMVYNLTNSKSEIMSLREQALSLLKAFLSDGSIAGSAQVDVFTALADLQDRILTITTELAELNKELTDHEKSRAKILLDINKSLGELYIENLKLVLLSLELTESKVSRGASALKTKDGKDTQQSRQFEIMANSYKKVNASFEVGTKIFNNYSKAWENFLKIKSKDNPEETKKAYKDLLNTFENLKEVISNNSSEFTGPFMRAFEALEGVLKDEENGVNNFGEALNVFKEKVSAVGGRIEFISQRFLAFKKELTPELLLTIGPIIDGLGADFENFGTVLAESAGLWGNFKTSGELAGAAFDEFKGKAPTVGEAVTEVGQTTMLLAMAFGQAQAAGEQLFDPDVSGLLKLTSVIMAVVQSISVFNSIREAQKTLTAAVTAAEKEETISKTKNALVEKLKSTSIGKTVAALKTKILGTNADTAATNANSAAVNTNTAAWYANPILAVVAVALLAVVAVIGAVSSAINKLNEELAENAEKEREALNAKKEELDANKELITTYEDALALYEETQANKEELASAAREVSKSYEIENAELLIQKGRYEELTEAINKKRIAELEAAKSQGKLAVADSGRVFMKDMRDDTGHISDGKYKATIGNGGRSKDENYAEEALKSLDLNTISKDGGEFAIETDGSVEGMIKAYKEAIALKEKMVELADGDTQGLADSEIYKNLTEWLDKSKESYDNLQEAKNANADISAELAVTEQLASDTYKDGITSITLYEQFVEDACATLEEEGMSADAAREAVENYISTQKELSGFKVAESNISSIVDLNSNLDKNELVEFYDGLSDEEKKVFLTLDFDTAESVKDLDAQLVALLKRADAEDILVKLQTVEKALSELKLGMSDEDYLKYETESGMNWGKDGIIDYNSFLAKTYEELVAYLTNLEKEYSSSFKQDILTAIKENNNLVKDYEQKILDIENLIKDNKNDDSNRWKNFGLEKLIEKYKQAIEDINNSNDEYEVLLKINEAETRELILNILSKEFKDGDTLSFKEFNALEELGVDNLENYLLEMSDGTYSLVGAAEDFNEAIKKANVEKAQDTLDNSALSLGKVNEGSSFYSSTNALLSTDGTGYETNYIQLQDLANYLKEMGIDTSSFTDKNGDIIKNAEAFGALLDAIKSCKAELEGAENTILNFTLSSLNSATSLTELKSKMAELGGSTELISSTGETDAGLASYDEYAQGLLNLASGYDSCAEASEAYQNALNALSDATDDNREALEDLVRTTQDLLEALISCEEAAKKYGLESDTLAAQANEIAKAEKISASQAMALAVANERMNRGVASLVNNWKDWKKILKSADKTAEDYAATLADVSDAVQDLVGWYDDLNLDSEFVEDNMDLIDKAAKGDTTAILELGAAVASYEVGLAQLNTTLSNSPMLDGSLNALMLYAEKLGEGTTAAEAFAAALTGVQAGFDAISSNLTNLQNNTMSLTDVLGGEQGLQDWVNLLNAYAAATGMTAEQMQQMLSSVGVTANVLTDYLEQEVTVPTYTEQITNIKYEHIPVTKADGSTGEDIVPIYTRASVPGPPLTDTGYVEVASISMDGDGETPGASPPKFTGKQAPSNTAKKGGTGNKGGGGSKGGSGPKPAEKMKTTKKDAMVERYKEVTDSLEDVARALEKANKKSDRFFGPAKIKALRELNKLLELQKTLLKQQINEAEKYLGLDKNALNKAAGDLGQTLKFDADGDVTNYTLAMEAIFNLLHDAEDHYNALGTKEAQDAYKEKVLDPLNEKIEEFKSSLSTYEETKKLIEDKQDLLEEIGFTEEDNRILMITYVVELKIDANERELKYLDYLLKNLERTNYDVADSIDLLNDKMNEYKEESVAVNKEISRLYKEAENQGWLTDGEIALIKDGKASEIDWSSKEIPDSWLQSLQDAQDKLLEINENLQATHDAINATVEQAYDKEMEEIDSKLAELDHYDSVFDHYKNITDLAGAERLGMSTADIAKMNQGKVDNAQNALAGKQAKYEEVLAANAEYTDNYKAAKRKYDKAKENGASEAVLTELAADVKTWEDMMKKSNEDMQAAEEEYLSAWEHALEVSRDAFLDNTERLLKDLEKQMAGAYGSFEAMQEDFDRQKTKNSEYLKEYEKLYELTKLNRDLNKKMDETSNVKAKLAMAELQEEILSYQEEGKEMSQYDLEYLQKKYDLRMAEIAMEEAQNAKSQVRMTQDAEGNYSYTYTADESSMADAQQNYEDKLHDIMDLSNNYVEDMTSQMISAEAEYMDKLAEINQKYADGEYATLEEYEAAMAECTEYYTGRIGYFTSEIAKATENNMLIYEEDYILYEGFIGGKIAASDAYLEALDGGVTKAKDDYKQACEDYNTALQEIYLLAEEGYYASEEERLLALAELDATYGARREAAYQALVEAVGDNTELMAAEKEYEDAQKTYKDNMESDYKKYVDNMNEIEKKRASGFYKTEEEYLAAKAKVQKDYDTLQENTLKKFDTAQKKYETAYENDRKKVEDANKQKAASNSGVYTSFTALLPKFKGQYDTAKGYADSWAKNAKTNTDKMKEYGKLYLKENKETFDKAKVPMDKYKEHTDKKMEEIKKASKKALKGIQDLTDEKPWKKSSDKVKDWLLKYTKYIGNIIAKNEEAYKSITKLTKAIAALADTKLDTKKEEPKKEEPKKEEPKNTGPQGDGKLEVGETATYTGGLYYSDSYGGGPTGSRGPGKKVKITRIVDGRKYPIHVESTDSAYGWLKKDLLTGYDTGGYTGDWNSSQGKIALLHLKELVLNADDTKNMLNIVSIVREISSFIDLLAKTLLNSFSGFNTNFNPVGSSGALEQEVTIHAEFPSVTNHNEIEEAFDTLINRASLFANRKY